MTNRLHATATGPIIYHHPSKRSYTRILLSGGGASDEAIDAMGTSSEHQQMADDMTAENGRAGDEVTQTPRKTKRKDKGIGSGAGRRQRRKERHGP